MGAKKKVRKRMKSLSKLCSWIAKTIKAKVKKPKLSDFFWYGDTWRTCDGDKCPMGMHPKATSLRPARANTFQVRKKVTDEQVACFGDWWDGLTKKQLRFGIRAIWG